MELSDDPYDGKRLELSNTPVLVTLTRIGNHCVVDPTPEEEACASACIVMGVTPKGRITAVRKTGAGSFHMETMADAVKMGAKVGVEVNEAFGKKLAEEESLGLGREKYGFLS
jgi:exosome complex component RRP42